MHCLHRRGFKIRLEICKNADKELSDIRAIRRHSAEIIISSSNELRDVSPHRGGDSHRRLCHTKKGVTHKGSTHNLYTEKNERSSTGSVHTRTEGRQAFLVQFVSTTMPAKQK